MTAATRTRKEHKFWNQCQLFLVLLLAVTAHAQRAIDGFSCDADTPVLFNDNGAWGYVTATGRTIPARFLSATPFWSGFATVCTSGGCAVLNTKGEFVTPLRDKRTANLGMRYSEGVGVVVVDIVRGLGKRGYVNLSGDFVIPPIFEWAGDFESGIARVRLNGRYFFIDHKGERITPEFDGLFDFSDGMAAALEGDRVGYIGRDGRYVLPPKYKGTSGIDFQEGLVAVRLEGKVGFIDKSGSVIVKPLYDDAYPFSEGLAPVRLGERWGYIDKHGKMVIPPKFLIVHMFNEGVASVQVAGTRKMGYIGHNGAFVIAPRFDWAMPFCAGLASVESFRTIGPSPDSIIPNSVHKGKHGLIDHSGMYIWRDAEDQVWYGP